MVIDVVKDMHCDITMGHYIAMDTNHYTTMHTAVARIFI